MIAGSDHDNINWNVITRDVLIKTPRTLQAPQKLFQIKLLLFVSTTSLSLLHYLKPGGERRTGSHVQLRLWSAKSAIGSCPREASRSFRQHKPRFHIDKQRERGRDPNRPDFLVSRPRRNREWLNRYINTSPKQLLGLSSIWTSRNATKDNGRS